MTDVRNGLLTIYGDIPFGDASMIAAFTDAHLLKHMSINDEINRLANSGDTLTWVNGSAVVLTWVNGSAATLTWVSGATSSGAVGTALSSVPLDPPLDADWFGRHHLLHRSIEDALGLEVGESIDGGDLGVPWTDRESFSSWHQIHNQKHRLIEQALGLV